MSSKFFRRPDIDSDSSDSEDDHDGQVDISDLESTSDDSSHSQKANNENDNHKNNNTAAQTGQKQTHTAITPTTKITSPTDSSTNTSNSTTSISSSNSTIGTVLFNNNDEFNSSFTFLANSIRKGTRLSISNRIHSIIADADFVQEVANAFELPLVANERCGSWYIPSEKKYASAYFKSTDGHIGQWKFSTRRLNLHILDVVAENNGYVSLLLSLSLSCFQDKDGRNLVAIVFVIVTHLHFDIYS